MALGWPAWPGVGAGETTLGLGLFAWGDSLGVPGARAVQEGGALNMSWVWEAAPSAGLLAFNFSHPSAPDVEREAALVAARFNMLAGNVFGNSPASIVCLHEMSWLPLVQALFDSEAGHTALGAELRLLATHALRPDGYVYPRWGYVSYQTMPIHDQMGHFLVSFYEHAVNTADAALIRDVWPALMAAVGYINDTMGAGIAGIGTTPTASGLPGSQTADNWFDIVNFGGRDAIVNAYICAGLNGTALLATWIGENDAALRLSAMHARCVLAFNALFWNETLGLYGDWVDTSDAPRHYGYIWQQAVAAEGLSSIANATRAARMAGVVRTRLAEIHMQYNMTEDELFCAPTNLWSVAPEDSFNNGTLQDQKEFGHYENGCCFMALNGMYAALLASGGDTDGAYAVLVAMLRNSEDTALWGQHYDWINHGTTNFNGPDVLTDTLVALRHGIMSAMGLRLALGSTWSGAPAAAGLEGASLTFRTGGVRVRAEVHGGRVRIVEV